MSCQQHLTSAESELDAGRPHLAIKFAQYAVTEEPDHQPGWELLATAAMKAEDYPVAIDAYEHLSLTTPIDSESRISLAIAYGGIGRHSLSKDLLMAVATGDPTAEQLLRIAAGLEAIDEPELAMEACRQAGRRIPEAAEVHYQLAYYASKCGRPTALSESLMRHAVHLEPQSLHYRTGLTSLLIRLNRNAEARRVIDRMIPERLSEITCACCVKRFANLFFDAGDLERARLCAERFAELSPEASTAAT
ncbi:MAG: hypothetical protein AAF539_01265 [Planctomycetota bacterium]